MRKVTAKGGGAAIPARPRLLGQLVAAAVAGAGGSVPVTVKMRIGLSDGIHTYLEARFATYVSQTLANLWRLGASGRAAVTVKMRIGLSDDIHMYLEACRSSAALWQPCHECSKTCVV